MNQGIEEERITGLIFDAVKVSTDPVIVAGLSQFPALRLENPEQIMHLARCIAAFTTDDALFAELSEIVGETPAFMISKVGAIGNELVDFVGEHAALERQVWTSLFAGRRERSRVMQTLRRRSAL